MKWKCKYKFVLKLLTFIHVGFRLIASKYDSGIQSTTLGYKVWSEIKPARYKVWSEIRPDPVKVWSEIKPARYKVWPCLILKSMKSMLEDCYGILRMPCNYLIFGWNRLESHRDPIGIASKFKMAGSRHLWFWKIWEFMAGLLRHEMERLDLKFE